jgi:hypothetical protein
MERTILTAAAVVIAMVATAGAQTLPNGKTIEQRKDNQQLRISQGVRSGQLTPRETAHLERQEGRLNREEHNMRAASGGRLTPADRAKLTRQQNRLSGEIYNKKHNAAVQH